MIGKRLSLADFQKHNGKVDKMGQPTYTVDKDWETVVAEWPCERMESAGNEGTRGRQTVSSGAYTFEGDPKPLLADVDTTCRLICDGVVYGIQGIHGLEVMSLSATVLASVEQ